MKSMCNSSLKITKYTFEELKMEFSWCMYEPVELLNDVSNVRACECEVL